MENISNQEVTSVTPTLRERLLGKIASLKTAVLESDRVRTYQQISRAARGARLPDDPLFTFVGGPAELTSPGAELSVVPAPSSTEGSE